METRYLGRSGLEVSVLSFGAMTFGEGDTRFAATGATHSDAARRQVDMCLDAGVTLFDTADVYSFASPRWSWARRWAPGARMR